MAVDMTVILISAAFFLALVLYVALEQEQRERITSIAFFIAAAGGIVIYGFSYSHGHNGMFDRFTAVLRTMIDVGRMFVGMNNEAAFREALAKMGFSDSAWLFLFWGVHFFAYYSMASAAVLALGKGAIRKLQQLLLNVRDLEIIYGITDSSLTLGRHVASDKHKSVIFIGRADASQELAIRQMGALLYSDDVALEPQEAFLKRLSLRRHDRKLHVYALSENEDANIKYAVHLLALLKKAEMEPQRTSLVLLGQEERHGGDLQATRDHYGYGEVKAFDHSELTARLLVQKYPISKAVEFDDDGLAKQDVEVLLVGFGPMGQEVLKKLIANGQFEGSTFHAHVFDPNCGIVDGFYRRRYAAMLKAYDVTFHSGSGRSMQFCDFLEEHAQSLTYIVVAIGNLKKGGEIAYAILDFLAKSKRKLPVYQCCNDTVVCYQDHLESEYASLHDADILFGGTMDDLAMKINHYYNDPEGSPKEQWMACDYFSRMSCRASADFLSAYLNRLCEDHSKDLTDEKVENMAKTEHLRWNAFHYSMGYVRMSDETWAARAEQFRKEVAVGGVGHVRISKDAAEKQHACLVSWDELDELSAKENEVTGKSVDYKQMDRDNVKVVLKLLKEDEK
ncbi:MAG: hypothetical protein IK081_07560 [Lachnospiraceae bacterium]|nr:hypothetical protein [Lachnospiraceae bacterium]